MTTLSSPAWSNEPKKPRTKESQYKSLQESLEAERQRLDYLNLENEKLRSHIEKLTEELKKMALKKKHLQFSDDESLEVAWNGVIYLLDHKMKVYKGSIDQIIAS